MKLEDQVVSLELAKKLKELGVKQQSYFHWEGFMLDENDEPRDWTLMSETAPCDDKYTFAAFTVAELGFPRNERWITHFDERAGFTIYGDGLHGMRTFNAPTEADARAKMLIYLLENKLITL